MKKLFIICLALIISLTSCDLSLLGGKDKTPEPELPMSETVTLAELINKEDVAYIKHKKTFHNDANNLTYITSHNVDELFAKVIEPNTDLEFIYDLEGDDLFDQKWREAWDTIYPKNGKLGDKYIFWELFNSNGAWIGFLRIFSNSLVIYEHLDYSSHKAEYYVSVNYANLDFDQLLEDLYE